MKVRIKNTSKILKMMSERANVYDILSQFKDKDIEMILNRYGANNLDKEQLGEYLYKIENIENGMVYIGKTKNPIYRITEHFYSTENKRMKSDVLKYGQQGFTFFCWEPPYDYNEAEKLEILKYEKSYNISRIQPKLPGL